MRLGFDAKRALNNTTGLGNHARILLNAMMRDFPENEYLLFSPKIKDQQFHELEGDFKVVLPETKHQRVVHPSQSFAFYSAILQPYLFLKKVGLWRSWGITSDLIKERVQLYHGLSNELPFNIHKTNIKTVVTIHDLIFLKHTEQYPFFDRQIYKLKTKYAAEHADKIIAVSSETKNDLINYYGIKPEKIEVIYPSVDPLFQSNDNSQTFAEVRTRYNLPETYLLHVGSFFPRKNQKTVIEAFDLVKNEIREHLVLVGGGYNTRKQIEKLIAAKNLEGRVHIISNISNTDLPFVYRGASIFIFPSLYEGFGAPVLEALFTKVPVIATKGGAIEEAGGPNSLYVDPTSATDIAESVLKIMRNAELRHNMIERGFEHAQTMTDTAFAAKTMQVYKGLIK